MSPLPRLLLLITSLDRGGAQRQVVDLATRLHADGWPVAVLSMIPPAEYVGELRAAGVRVASLRMHKGRPTPLAYARYGQFVRAWKPDVIHAHMVHANLLARLGRPFAPRVPVISTVHNVNEGARWRELAYRVTDRLSTMTTAVSEAAARQYVAVGAAPAGRIVAFPNGFDFAHGRPAADREATRASLGAGEGFLWVTAGRLDRQKGYDLLLEAVAALRDEAPDLRLAIAGDGPERAALDAQQARLGLGDVVRLLGDRADVPDLLAAADGFVLSSRWEGLPMVLLEAAAARRPIVCTDVGGNREIVRPELGGILVDADVAAIADGMRRVLAMSPAERDRIGGALEGHVRADYDMDVIAERWVDTYVRLSAERARVP